MIIPADGDGKNELVVGYTDRVVRAFRWEDSLENSENITGQLVLLKKWLLEGQVGNTVCRCKTPVLEKALRNEEEVAKYRRWPTGLLPLQLLGATAPVSEAKSFRWYGLLNK